MAEVPFAQQRANPRFSFFADAEITLNDGTSIRGQVWIYNCETILTTSAAVLTAGAQPARTAVRTKHKIGRDTWILLLEALVASVVCSHLQAVAPALLACFATAIRRN